MAEDRTKDAYNQVLPTDTSVPVDWVPLDGTDTPPAGFFCFRGIRAEGAGTVTVTTRGGSRVMDFAAGETRWCVILAVTAATATGLEGAL